MSFWKRRKQSSERASSADCRASVLGSSFTPGVVHNQQQASLPRRCCALPRQTPEQMTCHGLGQRRAGWLAAAENERPFPGAIQDQVDDRPRRGVDQRGRARPGPGRVKKRNPTEKVERQPAAEVESLQQRGTIRATVGQKT